MLSSCTKYPSYSLEPLRTFGPIYALESQAVCADLAQRFGLAIHLVCTPAFKIMLNLFCACASPCVVCWGAFRASGV